MQRVQARTLTSAPLSVVTVVFCRLGSQRLLVFLWEWLTLLPDAGLLPQIAHTFDILGFLQVYLN
jgi:hypothetical protein